MFKFDQQHITQGYQDADQFGKQLGEEVGGKATGEDRWQQSGFSLTNDAFQDSVHMPYNLPRPPSSLPTYTPYSHDIQPAYHENQMTTNLDSLNTASTSSIFGDQIDTLSIDPSLHNSRSLTNFSDLNTMSADPASLTHDRPSQPFFTTTFSSPDMSVLESTLSGIQRTTDLASISSENQPSDPASAQAGMSRSRLRVSSPPKRARKKSKKDPDAPKHPMSAFLYFLTTERPRLADQLSEMSIGQQTKIIAKKWKCLTDSERAPWERLAKNDKDRYARERREYHGEGRNSATPAAQS
ncbi:High mobility group [Linderina pennispora]|nr:High mobility group [Linderina pennispora]